jgi:Tol biopolymer transport system component
MTYAALRRSPLLSLLPLLAVAAALTAGCRDRAADTSAQADVGGNVAQSGQDGIDSYYTRYTGPLQVGRTHQGSRERNSFTEIGNDYDPAVSPDGKWLLFTSTFHSEVPQLYLKGVSSATVARLSTDPGVAEIQPCFSPDGKRCAYATNRRGNWDICVRSLEGGAPAEVTLNMKSDEISPSFHPRGEWLAFSTFSARTGHWEIAMRRLGGGQLRFLGEGIYPRFSPDGRKIAFQRARSRAPRWYSIWTLDLDEDMNAVGNPVEVVSSPCWAAINPAWSPDGRYLAFATVHESPVAQEARRVLAGDDIWAVNLDGQDLVRLTDGQAPESSPVWSRDAAGRERIYFCSMEAGPRNIWSLVPRLPEPYGSVRGRLPGPPESNPAPKAPGPEAGPDEPGRLPSYIAPPPPATSGGSQP